MAMTAENYLYLICFVICFLSTVTTSCNQSLYNLVIRNVYIGKAWTIVERFMMGFGFAPEQITYTLKRKQYSNYPLFQIAPARVVSLADQIVKSKFAGETSRWREWLTEFAERLPTGAPEEQIYQEPRMMMVAARLAEQIAGGDQVYWSDLLALYENLAAPEKGYKRTIDYEQVGQILSMTRNRLIEEYPGSGEKWEKKIELIRRSVPLDANHNLIITKKGAARWATVHEAPVKEVFLFAPITPTFVAQQLLKNKQKNPDLADLNWKDRKLYLLYGALGLSLILSTLSGFGNHGWMQWLAWPKLIATAILLLLSLYAVVVGVLSAVSMFSLISAAGALSGGAIETVQRLLEKMDVYGIFSKSDIISESIFPSSLFISVNDVVMLHEDTNYLEIKNYKQIFQRLTHKVLYSQARGSEYVDPGVLSTYLNICRKMETLTGNPLYGKLEQKARREYHLE
jgi:hypothetical protein